MSTPNIQLCGELTKCKLVSDVAKTYDVLGWFAPAVFFASVYCRELGRHEYLGMILLLEKF